MGHRGNEANPEIYKRVRAYFPEKRRTAIDCGAYHGEWSRMMAADFAVVHAFDIRPESVEHMRKDLPYNVIPHVAGLGARAEVLPFRLRFGKYAQLEGRENEEPDWPLEHHWVGPLDDYNFRDVDFIKIDVDGCEKILLDGALETIAHWQPVICIETKLMKHADHKRMLDLLQYHQIDRVSAIDEIWVPR